VELNYKNVVYAVYFRHSNSSLIFLKKCEHFEFVNNIASLMGALLVVAPAINSSP
jgi:hypothetical protein